MWLAPSVAAIGMGEEIDDRPAKTGHVYLVHRID
jgi:hypothetical protein